MKKTFFSLIILAAALSTSVAQPYPLYPIEVVSAVNPTTGVADSLDVDCSVAGIVHGINIRPSGLQFTIINSDINNGIGVFNAQGSLGYTVQEGDSIVIEGTIDQFRGLTQINPVSVTLVSNGNPINDPNVVTSLSEETESSWIRVNNVRLIDPGEWTGSGSGFNVRIVSDDNPQDTLEMRIDADTDMYNGPAPSGVFSVIGVGGQFDPEVPLLSGYQILPQIPAHIIEGVNTTSVDWSNEIKISPNPVSEFVNLRTEIDIDQLIVTDAQGREVLNIVAPQSGQQIQTSTLAPGLYAFRFVAGNQFWTTQIVKQ